MAKLNTTVSNIELQSNKIKGEATPSIDWSDTQYPSAKTVFNIYEQLKTLINTGDALDSRYPIGSIYVSSAETDPGETFGGTWDLVDKAFRDDLIDFDASFWNSEGANLRETYNSVALTDHSIYIRLHLELINNHSSDDELVLGKLNLASFGIEELPFAILGQVAACDGGQCTIIYRVATDGTFVITDVLNIDDTHSLAAGKDFYLLNTLPIPYKNMKSEFCDKFYWKRIG